VLFVGDNIAVANTQYGKVRGYILRGVHTFLGIPYGADTSGENRFMPPQKPKSWTDIKPAVWWGNSAPQIMEKRYANEYASFVDHWNYDDVSEDCLKINVWTPALDNKKRPVIVWLHGGGFVNGNGIEQDGYHGENLSRLGDVVFCSLNHRLGALGFTNLAKAGGEKLAASGNVGMLDIVTAVEWVRDNIAAFGGDPGNVTIFGARDYSMRIWLDPEKLAIRNLTAGDVVAALRGQNVQVAAGVINQPPVPVPGAFQLNVETQGRLTDPEAFGNIIVKSGTDGRVVRVHDIGRVELGAADYGRNGYLDLKVAVPLGIFQRPG